MGKSYVLAPAYAGVQFWNDDKSDLMEVRRQPGQQVVEVEDIPEAQAKRLLDLGAIVEADELDSAQAEAAGLPEEPAGNASRDEWAAYADALGLTLEPGMGREEIKQLISDSRA